VLAFAQMSSAQSVNGPLNFGNNFFVTGDYVVAGAYNMNSNTTTINGVTYTTGTINVPDAKTVGKAGNPGIQGVTSVPRAAQVVIALLYWQTAEMSTTVPGGPGSGENGFFRPVIANGPPAPGYPLSGVNLSGHNAVAWSQGGCSSGQTGKVVRTYRADVTAYLPEDPNGNILSNSTYQVMLPSVGNQTPLTLGATLVIIYRVLDPTVPLNSIVIYEGPFGQTTSSLNMTQTVQGFYDAAQNPVSKLTHIVGHGLSDKYQTVYLNGDPLPSLYGKEPAFPGYYGAWDNPTWVFPNGNLKPVKVDDSSATTEVAPTNSNPGCVSWGAEIFSTTVRNDDGDGVLNVWKENNNPHLSGYQGGRPGYCDASVNEGVCTVGDANWVDLPGAKTGEQDVFVQLDYMCSSLNPNGGCSSNTPYCSILNMNGTCNLTGGYSFDPNFPVDPSDGNGAIQKVVNAYVGVTGNTPHTAVHLHVIKTNAIDETDPNVTCNDINAMSPVCSLPNEPGVVNQPGVVGWPGGLLFLQNELIDPYGNAQTCTSATPPADCLPRFQHGKKDSYRYALFGHALGIANWTLLDGTLTNIVQSTNMVTFTTSAPHGLTADPHCTSDGNPLGRVTVAFAITNANLNGVYCIQSTTSTTFTIQATYSVSATAYYTPYTDPDLKVASGQAGTVSGFSFIGGSDSAITLGSWGASGSSWQVKAGTFMHELGHANGLTHGGLYFDNLAHNPDDYTPTVEANCKPNVQSVMSYLFQVDLLDTGKGTSVVDYSDQALNTLNETTSEAFAGSPLYPNTSWYVPYVSGQAATAHCDGSPLLPTDSPMSLNSDQPASSLSWAGPQDLNFDGTLEAALRGHSEWTSTQAMPGLDLRQVGATGSLTVAGGVGKLGGGGGVGKLGGGGGVGKLGGGGGVGKLGGGGGVGKLGGGGGVGELNVATVNSVTRPPRNLTASEGPSPRTITLSWISPTFGAIVKYYIYESIAGGAFTRLPGFVTGVTGAAPGTPYTSSPIVINCNPRGYSFAVTAVILNPGEQESAPSNIVSTILPDTTDKLTGCYALAAKMNSVSVIGFASPTNGATYTQGDKILIAIPVTDDYYPKNGPVPVTANTSLVAIGPLPNDGNCPSISSVPVFLNYNGTYPLPYTALPSGLGLGLSNNQFTYTWDTTNFNAGCYIFEADFDSGQVNQTEIQLLIFESDTTPHITQTTLPTATAGIPYTPNTIQESGGTAPFTWSIFAGALPPGLTLTTSGAAGGTISGTATTAGTYNFTVKIVDKNGNYGTQQFSLKVLIFVSESVPSTVTSTIPTATAAIPYSNVIQQYGAVGAVTWTVTSGALPPGNLTLTTGNAGNGVVSGTPTTAGNYNFTATATDSSGNTGSLAFSAKVNIFVSGAAPLGAPPYVTSTLPTGTAAIPYSNALYQQGAVGAVTWAYAGTLPPGVTPNPANSNALMGTPTTAGNYSFTATATDSAGNTGSLLFHVKVNVFVSDAAPLGASPYVSSTLPTGTAGIPYSNTLYQTGAVGAVTWAYTGALPPGVLPTPASSNALSGTPTTAGGYSFTATATDSAGNTGSLQFTVTVLMFVSKTAPPTLTTTLLTGTATTGYSDAVLEYGGTGIITFTNTSPLPPGLSLNASTGAITGAPTTAGTYNFTMQVTDSATPQNVATQTFTVTVLIFVSDMPAAPVDMTLPNATVGTGYTNTIDQTGAAPGTLTWSLTAGALPPGLSLGVNTGMVSGTPTAPGNYNFTAQVTDSASPPNVATQSFALSVADAVYGDLIVVDGASTAGTLFRITPSGTSGTIAAIANGSPTGVAVDATNGNIYVAVDAVGGKGISRVVKVGLFGVVTDPFISGAPLANPVAIAVDASGNVYVGDNTTNAIYEFNSSGTQVGSNPFASLPSSSNVPNHIRMAFDGSGDLFVASDNTGGVSGVVEVDKIPSGGALTTLYNTTTQSTATYMLTAAGMASGGNTTYAGTFSPVPAAGSLVTISGFSGTQPDPNNGGPWVVQSGSTNAQLVLSNPNGVAETNSGTATVQLTQIGSVGGIAVLANGSIDLADYGAKSIYNIMNPGALNMSITTAFSPLVGNISGMANPPSVANTNLYTTLNGATPQLDLVVPETSSVTVVNSTYTLTAAGTASGGNTTYTGTLSATIPVGSLITISGFTNPVNNGTFVVVSSISSQLVVVNANGSADTSGGTAQTVPLSSPNDVAWYSKH
jgi:hypothetical protein